MRQSPAAEGGAVVAAATRRIGKKVQKLNFRHARRCSCMSTESPNALILLRLTEMQLFETLFCGRSSTLTIERAPSRRPFPRGLPQHFFPTDPKASAFWNGEVLPRRPRRQAPTIHQHEKEQFKGLRHETQQTAASDPSKSTPAGLGRLCEPQSPRARAQMA